MRYWVPRKGDRVVPNYDGPYAAVMLRRRLGVWDEDNEHWEAWSPFHRRVVTVAVGTFYVRWEGRR